MKKLMMLVLVSGAAASAQTVATVVSADVKRVDRASDTNYKDVYKNATAVYNVKSVPTANAIRKMCRDAMLEILKSPGSTKFVKDYGTEYWIQAGTYLTGGALDSQNSYGALLRREYLCTSIFIGGRKGGKFYVDPYLLGDR